MSFGVLDLQKAVLDLQQTKVISEIVIFEVLSFIYFSTGEMKCALDRTSAETMDLVCFILPITTFSKSQIFKALERSPNPTMAISILFVGMAGFLPLDSRRHGIPDENEREKRFYRSHNWG